MIEYLFTKTPFSYLVQNFWRDEAFTYFMAKLPISNLLVSTAQDFNPPLYYILIHFWMKVAGSSEIMLRIPSLIFYWATLLMVYLFLNRVMKLTLRKSIIYTILFLANPLLHYYAFEARMYTMFAFFATASFYFFCTRRKVPYIAFTILGLYTHYFMLLAVACQGLILFVQSGFRPTRAKIIEIATPLLAFIPWGLLVLFVKPLNTSSRFWIETQSWRQFTMIPGKLYTGFEPGFWFFKDSILSLSNLILVIFILGAVFTYLNRRKENTRLFFTFFVWSLGIAFAIGVISFVKPIFLPRYLIFSSVGLFLLIVWSLEQLPNPVKAFLFLAIFTLTFQYQSLQIKERKKGQISDTMKEIKALAKPGDKIYVTSDLDYFTIQYYYPDNQVYVYHLDHSQIADYVGKVLIPKSAVTSTLPLYPQKAFILNADRSYAIMANY